MVTRESNFVEESHCIRSCHYVLEVLRAIAHLHTCSMTPPSLAKGQTAFKRTSDTMRFFDKITLPCDHALQLVDCRMLTMRWRRRLAGFGRCFYSARNADVMTQNEPTVAGPRPSLLTLAYTGCSGDEGSLASVVASIRLGHRRDFTMSGRFSTQCASPRAT
jgi:hypothetical protein